MKKTSETESRASGDTDPSFDDNFQAEWWKPSSATLFPVERFLLNDDDPVAVATIKEMCRDVKTRVLNKASRKTAAAQAKKAAQKRMKPETERIQKKSPKQVKWMAAHIKPLQDAGTLGIQWPPNLGAKVARFMTNREEGILALALASDGKAWAATASDTDASQSEHRTPHRHGLLPCIIPNSRQVDGLPAAHGSRL